MIPDEVLRNTINTIRQQPDLNGCIIGLQADRASCVVDQGCPGENLTSRYLVIEEVTVPGYTSAANVRVVEITAPPAATRQVPAEAVQQATTNASRVNVELRGMGLSCSAMVITGIVAVAGSATGIGVLAWIGFATSAAACVNATMRYREARHNPDSTSLFELDHNGYYVAATLVVDAIGVGAGVVGGVAGARTVIRLLQARGGLGGVYTLEAVNAAIRNMVASGGRAELISAMRIAGFNGRAVAGNLLSARRPMAVLTTGGLERLASALNRSVASAAGASADLASGINGVITSGQPSDRVGAASGSVNWAANRPIIVHIVNRLQESLSR